MAAREQGIKSVAVTAGYITPQAAQGFFSHMDAANIDLKAFTDDFYRGLCLAELEPVKDTLRYVAHETDCWLEVTTLLIPGQNDDEAELEALAQFMAEEVGAHVPLHFSAFHPDYRMTDLERTPHSTLLKARSIAEAAGCRHVYVGNVHDPHASSTWCHACGERLIERDWYELGAWNVVLGKGGHAACGSCGERLDGRFDAAPGHFGRRRVPLRVL